MNDMTSAIVPKSDQMSADDLLTGPRTIRVSQVEINPGTEQPVIISYEGDNGRPWKPCKSMSRVLVNAWGPDAKMYQGRSITLFRDPTVKWGGMEVGGIRISHLSDIDNTMKMSLTATRGKFAAFTVQPLKVESVKPNTDKARAAADKFIEALGKAPDLAQLNAFADKRAPLLISLAADAPDIHAECQEALKARKEALMVDEPTPADDDPFA